jgi:hypothetical protein
VKQTKISSFEAQNFRLLTICITGHTKYWTITSRWRLISSQTRYKHWISQPVRSAYQPPASSTFLSERTSHQQPAATRQQYSSLRTNQHQPSATSQPNNASGGSHYGLLDLWCTTTRIFTWKWQPISSDGKQKQTQFRTTEFHKWGQIVPHSGQMEYWTGGWTGNHCSKVETLETVKSNELVLVARPNAYNIVLKNIVEQQQLQAYNTRR